MPYNSFVWCLINNLIKKEKKYHNVLFVHFVPDKGTGDCLFHDDMLCIKLSFSRKKCYNRRGTFRVISTTLILAYMNLLCSLIYFLNSLGKRTFELSDVTILWTCTQVQWLFIWVLHSFDLIWRHMCVWFFLSNSGFVIELKMLLN